MDIPIKAAVNCQKQECGQTICVIVNPRTDDVSHVVVEEITPPYQQRIVPIELVEETTPTSINLICSEDEFHNLEEFTEHHFIPSIKTYGVNHRKRIIYIPFTSISDEFVDIIRERVPKGGISLHQKTFIEANDGEIGKLEEFLVDPVSEHITHLIVNAGTTKRRREFAVPASEIDHIENDIIHLNVSKDQIESFPLVDSLSVDDPQL
jgi:hypothetical protein